MTKYLRHLITVISVFPITLTVIGLFTFPAYLAGQYDNPVLLLLYVFLLPLLMLLHDKD